jgi:hypothetical protein
VQREAATFDRLSDLINYQREARFLAYVRWAEERDYDLAKARKGRPDYSGGKLEPESSLHSMFDMFSKFNALFLVHLIRERHSHNREACLAEERELHRTITSAPVKFQWNQVGVDDLLMMQWFI